MVLYLHTKNFKQWSNISEVIINNVYSGPVLSLVGPNWPNGIFTEKSGSVIFMQKNQKNPKSYDPILRKVTHRQTDRLTDGPESIGPRFASGGPIWDFLYISGYHPFGVE